MPTKRIVNASPLILLTKIGRIDLLDAEDVDVVVPVPVLQEVASATRLEQGDFAPLTAKTIARIERNEVEKPHGKTLQTIARRLGVNADQIESY